MFHVIKDIEWFERVILLLKKKYDLVKLEAFEDLNKIDKDNEFCHITFDDGDNSFYKFAYPILKKHNVPATLFVLPKILVNQENIWSQEVKGYEKKSMLKIISRELSLSFERISSIPVSAILKSLELYKIKEIITLYQKETNTPPKSCQNMNLDEVLEVEKSGLITIGAHTLNHPILKNESDNNSEYEITGSIKELEKLLRHEVRYFAYPNGIPKFDFGEREISCLKKNNIAITVSTETKFVSKHDHILALPRIGIEDGTNMRFLKIKLILGSKLEKIKSLLGRPSESKNREKFTSMVDL